MITTFSIEFVVFECFCKDKSLEKVTIGRIDGVPGEIIELTQKRVWKATEGCLGFGKRGILAIEVYEVRFFEIL